MKKYVSNATLSINERNFVLEALKEQHRVDGRRFYDFRNLTITFGSTLGVAEVQLGTTRVVTSVSCELVEPQPERATEGFYIFNTEFSPMAEPSFDSARPTDSSIEIGRVIERGLRESRAIDTEALCVVAGVKVWSVRCDIHIIDHGGNLLDCASIATIAALLHFRRPVTSVVDNRVVILPIEDKEPLPLSIHHIPVAISFAIFEDGQIIVVDPNFKEELVMEGKITFTLNSHREICAVQKSGGIPLSLDQIIQCSRIAAVKAEEISQIIQTSLKEQNKLASTSNYAINNLNKS